MLGLRFHSGFKFSRALNLCRELGKYQKKEEEVNFHFGGLVQRFSSRKARRLFAATELDEL